MTKITIRDVAREAGVSISTVSNALNDVDVLNPATKQHVLEVAERLNYVPNLNGKMLKSGKTMMLGFFTTSVSGPYFYKLIETMSRQCERHGYGLNVFVTKDKSVIMSNILGRRVDGVIIYEELKIDAHDIEVMQKDKIKTVFLDREFSNETVGSVTFDSYAAGYEAAKYLIGLGHKRIAYISGVDTMFDSVQRREGYRAALREYDLPIDPDYVIQGYFEEDSTFNAIKAFIRMHGSKLPSAFLAGNDLSAMGCIQALKAHGYEVPGDVSVVGFDDVDIAQYFSPPLTTVRNPIARQAILTVDQLVRMIQGKDEGHSQTLTGELIVRGSSHVPVDRAE